MSDSTPVIEAPKKKLTRAERMELIIAKRIRGCASRYARLKAIMTAPQISPHPSYAEAVKLLGNYNRAVSRRKAKQQALDRKKAKETQAMLFEEMVSSRIDIYN